MVPTFSSSYVLTSLFILASDLVFSVQLIYDAIKAENSGKSDFADCLSFFPPEVFAGR